MVKSAEGKLVVSVWLGCSFLWCISLLFATVIYLVFFTESDFESAGRTFESCRARQ